MYYLLSICKSTARAGSHGRGDLQRRSLRPPRKQFHSGHYHLLPQDRSERSYRAPALHFPQGTYRRPYSTVRQNINDDNNII